MCDFLAVVDRQNSGISLCSCYKDIVYKHKNAEGCNLQVAGQNLKYARTVNAKLILRKKLSLQRHTKLEISLVPGNCLFGVRFCSPEPHSSKFLSFTLLKITANGKKPDVKLWWLMI